MPMTRNLFLGARRMPEVVGVALIAAAGVYLVSNIKIPSLTPSAQDYSAAVVFTVAPALSSVIALGMLGSGLHEWENLAARSLFGRRLALGATALLLSLLVVLPSTAHAAVADPALVALQGALMCTGIGMVVSRWAGYAAQASSAFLYAVVSLNASRALDGHLAAVLAIGSAPTSEGMLVACVVAVIGLLVQAGKSPGPLD